MVIICNGIGIGRFLLFLLLLLDLLEEPVETRPPTVFVDVDAAVIVVAGGRRFC